MKNAGLPTTGTSVNQCEDEQQMCYLLQRDRNKNTIYALEGPAKIMNFFAQRFTTAGTTTFIADHDTGEVIRIYNCTKAGCLKVIEKDKIKDGLCLQVNVVESD